MTKGFGPSQAATVVPCSAPHLNVVKIDPHADARWGDFVADHPQATIYHHPAWIQAIETEYGQRADHLACEDEEGELLAILPLLHTRGLPLSFGEIVTKSRLCSLPRTPVAGPLSLHREATIALLQEAVNLTRRFPGRQLQIKTAGPELDGLVAGLAGIPWRKTYILKLPEESAGPFRLPDAKERAKIKWSLGKAARVGLRVRVAESEADLRNWYAAYLETMRRITIPPRPYRFFEALWKSLRPAGMLELRIAEYGSGRSERVVAGSVFLKYGETVSYSFNGMRERDSALPANDVILWQTINDACAQGFRRIDFGEVPEGHDSLAKFKAKWGAQPESLYRYYAPMPRSESVASHRESQSLARAVWRRLPLGLTAWLGDRVYSYL